MDSYATSLPSTFSISSRSGDKSSFISPSSSMSSRNTSATVEKQYMPRSKSLYARPVIRSFSAICSCVSPLRFLKALTYSEKNLRSISLYGFMCCDLRFDRFLHLLQKSYPITKYASM